LPGYISAACEAKTWPLPKEIDVSACLADEIVS
jgi:hypothetical protein